MTGTIQTKTYLTTMNTFTGNLWRMFWAGGEVGVFKRENVKKVAAFLWGRRHNAVVCQTAHDTSGWSHDFIDVVYSEVVTWHVTILGWPWLPCTV